MTLGFSVEDLLPYARSGGALAMGLRTLSPDNWLDPNPDIEARRKAFDAFPEAIVVQPEAQHAAREVASMIGSKPGFDETAASIWEDLCILTKSNETEEFRLTGAAVAFPTDWRLSDKMGHTISTIHAPIHGYAEQLSEGVNNFLESLVPSQIFARTNWFVVANNDLRYLPDDNGDALFDGLNTQNAGGRLFVRSERQTLRRLSDSRAVLFTIGVYVEPLKQLSVRAVEQIAKAVASVGKGEHERRAAPFYSAALTAYAETRFESC